MSSVSTVPVVTTKKGVSLADHLELRNLPLGTTPGGKAFAMKSLHPSDSDIKAARLPGRELPSVAIACDMVETIPWPVNATQLRLVQVPNPLIPLSGAFYDVDGNYISNFAYSNPALGGVGYVTGVDEYSDIIGNFWQAADDIVSYCITAESLTAELIAPMLTDQGTILAAQIAMAPRTTARFDVSDNGTDITQFVPYPDLYTWEKWPKVSTLLMGTNAYTSKARDGCYQPLKIRKFKDKSPADPMIPVTNMAADIRKNFPSPQVPRMTFPWQFPGMTKINMSTHALPKMTSDTIGITIFDGVDGSNSSVSVRIRFRQVVDVIAAVGGRYAPMTEAPLPPDNTALHMVRDICSRMRDGYPASYNDQDKLKGIVGKIGEYIVKFSDPALSLLNAFIPGVSLLSGPAKALGQGMQKFAGMMEQDSLANAQIHAAPNKPLPVPPVAPLYSGPPMVNGKVKPLPIPTAPPGTSLVPLQGGGYAVVPSEKRRKLRVKRRRS